MHLFCCCSGNVVSWGFHSLRLSAEQKWTEICTQPYHTLWSSCLLALARIFECIQYRVQTDTVGIEESYYIVFVVHERKKSAATTKLDTNEKKVDNSITSSHAQFEDTWNHYNRNDSSWLFRSTLLLCLQNDSMLYMHWKYKEKLWFSMNHPRWPHATHFWNVYRQKVSQDSAAYNVHIASSEANMFAGSMPKALEQHFPAVSYYSLFCRFLLCDSIEFYLYNVKTYLFSWTSVLLEKYFRLGRFDQLDCE